MLNTYYIGVKAIIYDASTNKILILEKNTANQSEIFYDLPGGRVENNETLSHTLARELEEEIGLCLEEDQISAKTIGCAQITNDLLGSGVGLCLVYIPIKLEQTCIPKLSEEHKSFAWYTQKEFTQLVSDHPQALQESVSYIQEIFNLYTVANKSSSD